MAHSIGLGIIGLDSTTDKILSSVLQNNVIPVANIHVVESDPHKLDKYESMGIHCEPDVSASTLRSEIMILSGNRQAINTTLSEICGVTRGKILVSTIEGRDCEYIQSRVAKGTNVVCVKQEEADGETVSKLSFSKRFPNHMKSAINDIFKSIGSIEIVEE